MLAKRTRESSSNEIFHTTSEGAVASAETMHLRHLLPIPRATLLPSRTAYVFRNHIYPQVGELKNAGKEFECAKLLDMHQQVTFLVRNLERPQYSFRLPTSTDVADSVSHALKATAPSRPPPRLLQALLGFWQIPGGALKGSNWAWESQHRGALLG